MKTPVRWRALPRRPPCQYSCPIDLHNLTPPWCQMTPSAVTKWICTCQTSKGSDHVTTTWCYMMSHCDTITPWCHGCHAVKSWMSRRDVKVWCQIAQYVMTKWICTCKQSRNTKKIMFLTWRHWPLTYDLDLWTYPRYCQDESLC